MLDVQLFMSVVTGFVVFIKGSTLTVYHDCATGNRFLAFDCLQCHEKGVEHKEFCRGRSDGHYSPTFLRENSLFRRCFVQCLSQDQMFIRVCALGTEWSPERSACVIDPAYDFQQKSMPYMIKTEVDENGILNRIYKVPLRRELYVREQRPDNRRRGQDKNWTTLNTRRWTQRWPNTRPTSQTIVQ